MEFKDNYPIHKISYWVKCQQHRKNVQYGIPTHLVDPNVFIANEKACGLQIAFRKHKRKFNQNIRSELFTMSSGD
jgi:hypothetical protein